MKKLVLLIGSGFSKNAEYPTGNELNQKFFENIENRMLSMSSGEWVWDDYDDATSNNGRLNSDYLNISYLLSEFIEKYQQNYFKVFNYEEFYDWLSENYGNEDLINELTVKVNERLKKDFQLDEKSNHIIKDPNINHYRKIYESFNYLIGDLLLRPYKRQDNKSKFDKFINYLKNFEDVEIYTLNHDLLLEYLLSESKIKYSDGFSVDESTIRGQKDDILKIFNNTYGTNIRLYKLHGSVDYYRFDEMIEEGVISKRTGKYWFYKPETYHNKHFAKRIDLKTKEIVQRHNFNTLPQFLTGKNKKDFIVNQTFYGDLYKTFNNAFRSCKEFMIIGYSFADLHINSVIKLAVDKYEFSIKNVNPGMNFPFRKNYSTNGIDNISSIEKI